MEGGTSTCSDAGKISRRPVAWIYPSQCDVVGPTRCPLPTNSGSIGGAVGDALTALAMSPGSEVDVASTASASDDPFEVIGDSSTSLPSHSASSDYALY
jgi:hypothetical protein